MTDKTGWMPIETAPRDLVKRRSLLNQNNGCWEWSGTLRNGYGRLTVGSRTDGSRRSVSAHRFSFEAFHGPIGDLYVCHTCDNRCCVNPDHLFLGTAKDNADDRDKKGRNIPPPRLSGTSSPMSKLTLSQVEEIRESKDVSRVLAPKYGICDSQIRAIRRMECYLPSPEPPEQKP